MAITAVSAGAVTPAVSPVPSQTQEIPTKVVEREGDEKRAEASKDDAAVVEFSDAARSQVSATEESSAEINFTAVIEEGGEEVVPHPAQAGGSGSAVSTVDHKAETTTVHSSNQGFSGYDNKGEGHSAFDSPPDSGGKQSPKEQLNTYA